MRKTRALHRAFNWAFLLLSLILLFRLGGAWHNSLARGQTWISEKVSRDDLPGAIDFMTSPSTLRGETLRLGAWLGHQRIHTKEFINLPKTGELRFDLRLGRESFVIFSFVDEQGNQPVAIRLSRTMSHPSAIFAIRDEVFLNKKNLPEVKLNSSYNTVYLRWTSEKSELQIDKEHFPISISLPARFQLGFAGGIDGADALKNIRFHELGHHRALFHEYFLPQYGKSLAALLFCIFILLVVITGFLSEKNRFLVNLVVLVVLFFSVMFNERVLLPRAARLTQLAEIKSPDILEKSGLPVILLNGFPDAHQLAIAIENSVSAKTKKLWSLATKVSEGISPAYLVLGIDLQTDTSCSDRLASTKQIFPKSKLLFLEIPQENKLDVAALKRESDCIELAKREKLPFLSARKPLEENFDAGYIWWDHWHLTHHGMELFLSAVTPELAAYVSR